jgi:molybdenum cofactor synthesis domain-containing protein
MRNKVEIAVLTISDRSKQGIYQDESGPLIVDFIRQNSSWDVTQTRIVADEVPEIKAALTDWYQNGVNLILTTGGTGFGPRDVTPEATRLVIEREAPGVGEALRIESLKITPYAMLSRGIAGIVGATLIINLPGSPKAVVESMQVLMPVLPHALELLGGDDSPHTID